MDGISSDLEIQAAARWYARLQAPDCSVADRAEFGRWCAEDSAHAAAYALARDTAASLAFLAQSDPRLRDMVAKAVATKSSVPTRARLRRHAPASGRGGHYRHRNGANAANARDVTLPDGESLFITSPGTGAPPRD